MKCPFRKKTATYPCGVNIPVSSNKPNIFKIEQGTIEEEEFLECYKENCPFYVPEQTFGEFTTFERCLRVSIPKPTKLNL